MTSENRPEITSENWELADMLFAESGLYECLVDAIDDCEFIADTNEHLYFDLLGDIIVKITADATLHVPDMGVEVKADDVYNGPLSDARFQSDTADKDRYAKFMTEFGTLDTDRLGDIAPCEGYFLI